MENKGKIVDRKENIDRTTYTLQLEQALQRVQQDYKIIKHALDGLVEENGRLRIRIAELELR
jgi:regulator of replication initiation timing